MLIILGYNPLIMLIRQVPIKRYLYLTVFTAGMATLALELTASRLLGAVFGTSNLVWASIIGLILIYLTAGYFWGGRWADRSPYPKTLYTILAWGALTAGLVPLVARPVLNLAAQAFDQLQLGVLFGSFTAVLILFSPPVILLGMVSPFAIRLAIENPEGAGTVSGRVYAISTLGSFIGTFLPVLLTIPLIGTTLTFALFSAILLVVALLGLWLFGERRRALIYLWMPIILLVATLLVIQRPIKTTQGQIYESESAYNYIQVLEVDGYRLLRLNEGQGIHSVWHPELIDYYGPWELFLAAPFYNSAPYDPEQVNRIAIVGLAAGTFARQASQVYGPIPIDGFEIDSEIIEVGKSYFDMNQPNLNAIAVDGRWGLMQSDQRYTIIALDAYRPPYIPWHLTTVEFFQLVQEHLEPDGVAVINVGSSAQDRRLVDGLVATMSQVFPSVHVVDVPGSFNSILYATIQPTTIEDFYRNYLFLEELGDVHPLLLEAVRRVIVNQQITPTSGMYFTDDRAPIEWITNNMVLNYLFSEGVETSEQ